MMANCGISNSYLRWWYSVTGVIAAMVLIVNVSLPTIASAASYSVVTFAENANPNDSLTATQESLIPAPLTLFADLPQAFSNPGFTFNYWTSNQDGTGSKFTDGEEYDFTLGNIVLWAQWIPNQVTFYENATGSDSVSALQYASTDTPLTLFSDLNPNFSKPGYVFAGWATSTSGAGTTYADGSTYDFTLGSTSLYAQWTPATYSINYAAGGGTATATSSTFTTGGSPITLPSASEPGYNFNGWYTAAQGGSFVGASGALFTPTSPTTLYAQWSAATSYVSFVGNGDTVSIPSASYTTGAAPLRLPTPTQAGFAFDGWFTAPQGGVLVGTAGSSYQPMSSTTLFAQWTAIPTFTVTFSTNGGVGSVGSVTALSGSTPSLPSPASISRPGYVFTGWNTVADGSGIAIDPSSSFTLSGPMTLYAQWRQLPAATITFVMNGARGSVTAISAYGGAVETLPTPPALARPGYVFTGWNTRANGKGSSFAGGVTMTLGTSLRLYAQWKGHAPARLVSPIGPFTSARNAVTGSLVAQVNRLASLIIRQRRNFVTLYGYPSTAVTAQAELSEGRARVAAVASSLRRALANAHHGGVRVVVVDEGLSAGTSNRVSVVVR